MRYKTLIVDKLISISNGLKQLRFHAERGELREYREKTEKLEERLEEIQSLINTQDERYEQ
jgi:hypothetical protein